MAGISSYCMACLLRNEEERIRNFSNEKKNAAYYKEVCRLIGESDDTASAPVLVAQKAELFKKYYGIEDDYKEQKIEFNQLMLRYEESVWKKIEQAKDEHEIFDIVTDFYKAYAVIGFEICSGGKLY